MNCTVAKSPDVGAGLFRFAGICIAGGKRPRQSGGGRKRKKNIEIY
jgi:hypothetical protein